MPGDQLHCERDTYRWLPHAGPVWRAAAGQLTCLRHVRGCAGLPPIPAGGLPGDARRPL